MGAQTLPGRMAIDKGLNLADDLGVAAGLEVRVDSFLDHSKALLLQPGDLGLGEGLEFKVGQRSPAPEVERFRIMVARCTGSAGRGRSRRAAKARQIRPGPGASVPSAAASSDYVCAKGLPEL